MPKVDMSDWKLNAKERATDPAHTIEGEARDITNQASIEEDAVDLSAEPAFTQDPARDRGPSLQTFVAQLPYGPIRSLDPHKLDTKAHLFEQLNASLPLNELNLPNFIYRPDMLDHTMIQRALLAFRDQAPTSTTTNSQGADSSEEEPDLFSDTILSSLVLDQPGSTTTAIRVSPETRFQGIQDIQSQMEAAMIHLEYHEGFPALPDGTPFWERLATEPENAFDAFFSYIEAGPTRKRKDLIAYPTEQVNEWFHIYFWTYRVKAFELFKVVDANKRRVFRMLQTEDSHFKQAEKLLTKVTATLDGYTAEEWKDVGIERLIGALEKLVKVQRISAGLSANGGAIEPEDLKRAPSTQVIVNQIVENTPETQKNREDDLDLLVDSPESVEMAQQLIISTQANRNPQ